MEISLTPDSAGVYAQIFAALLIALALERFESLSKEAPFAARAIDLFSRMSRALGVFTAAVAVAILFPVIGGAEVSGFATVWVHVTTYICSIALASWAGVRIGMMFIDARN
ncbi:hypothetical protein [Arthrobacter luteolus]|uniref:hypothetical protein n=1 Tax=Arthrobacter luteolus TaxID=98672 RepID=UPI00083623A0|nr:hypothetical protein [Arthrobacter luteolus]